MNRPILFSNRICEDKFRRQKMQDHVHRRDHVIGKRIDNATPKQFAHMKKNAKKKQMKKDRLREIQLQNKHLARRMVGILSRPTAQPKAMEFTPGLRLNAAHYPLIDCYLSPRSIVRGAAVEKKSLNYGIRKRENDRIVKENHAFLKRIVQQKPLISALELEKDHLTSEQYFRMRTRNDISEPGVDLTTPRPPSSGRPLTARPATGSRGARTSTTSPRGSTPGWSRTGGRRSVSPRPRTGSSAAGARRRAGGENHPMNRPSTSSPRMRQKRPGSRVGSALTQGASLFRGSVILRDGREAVMECLWQSTPARRFRVTAMEPNVWDSHKYYLSDTKLMAFGQQAGLLPSEPDALASTWTRTVRSRAACRELASFVMPWFRFVTEDGGRKALHFDAEEAARASPEQLASPSPKRRGGPSATRAEVMTFSSTGDVHVRPASQLSGLAGMGGDGAGAGAGAGAGVGAEVGVVTTEGTGSTGTLLYHGPKHVDGTSEVVHISVSFVGDSSGCLEVTLTEASKERASTIPPTIKMLSVDEALAFVPGTRRASLLDIDGAKSHDIGPKIATMATVTRNADSSLSLKGMV